MSLLESGFTATITSGQQDSAAVDLKDFTLCGFFTPAALTGTALSFKACATVGGTYVPVHDAAGTLISKTVAAARYTPLNPEDFAGLRYIKVRSGSAEGADRIITLAARRRF